jgi:WD40 repeat protein
MRVLQGVKQSIAALAFSPDGTRLAAGGSAPRVHLWDVDSARATPMLGTFGPFVAVTFWGDYVIAVTNGGEVRLRELSSEKERTLGTGMMYVTHAVVAPRRKTLIVTGVDHDWRRALRAWTLPDLRPAWQKLRPYAAESPYSLALSPDEETLAGGGAEVNLHDPANGKRRNTLAQTSSNVRRLTFSPDGRLIAAAVENRVLVWGVSAWGEVANLGGRRKHPMAVAFHPGGQFLAAASTDGTVRFFDTATWSQVAAFDWGTGPMREVAFSPDGMRAAAGGAGGRIVVWDVDL